MSWFVAGNDGLQQNSGSGSKPCDDPELPLGAMGGGDHRGGDHDPEPTELESQLDEKIHRELGVSTLCPWSDASPGGQRVRALILIPEATPQGHREC